MSAATNLRDEYDVAVIGAGPAGMAAATLTAEAGLSTVLLDENASVGGQIYRSITSTPLLNRSILGEDYWVGQTLVRPLKASRAQHVPGATVWSLSRDREIGVSFEAAGDRQQEGGGAARVSRMLRAKRVIIATGALERPFPIPGWTLPGVMTAGGAQTMLKASGLVPAGKVVLAGTGPLLWLLASQLIKAGVTIQALLDTTPKENRRRAMGLAPAFLVSPYLVKGLALLARVRRKVRVVADVTSLAAEGGDRLESLVYAVAGGRTERMPVDTLLLHQGVVPSMNLALSLGLAHSWDEEQLCFVPVIDAYGTSSVEGIAIAGDGAGIAGARVAEERGRLAAIAAVRALKPGAELPEEFPIRQALVRFERGRAFFDRLYRPAKAFRIPTGDTIVCRCEEVTARQVVDTVALGVEGPNQMKSFLRCGMGSCQGRLCALTVTELIAETRGVAPAAVGTYRLRPPVKPISLGELAAMDKSEPAVKAVVRG